MLDEMTAPLRARLGDEHRRLVAYAVVVAFVVLIAIGESESGVAELVLLPPAALAYLARVRYPRCPNVVPAVVGLIAVLVVNLPTADAEFAMFIPVVGAVLLASQEANRLIAKAYLGVSVGAVFVLGVTGASDWAWANWVAALIMSWVFGAVVYEYDRALEELEATRARMVDQAVLVERRKISSDVHDLVGHSLAVVLLHLAGARRLIRTDPDEAEAALVQAEQVGRDSMGEIRRAVALLRDEQVDASAPMPDLSDIAGVVERYRDAGLAVTYHATGRLDGVDGPRAVAGHRIVAEALANVSKHTEGAVVEVGIDVSDDACSIRVENRGGRQVAALGPGGHGLIGMRERALSAGGSLLAGPTEGGWCVDAVFPLEPRGADVGD